MTLREDATAIWKAGVEAVDSAHLVKTNVRCNTDTLTICDQQILLNCLNRIEIVGAGKAGAGMARGMIESLAQLPNGISVSGWINVPENCVEPLKEIHLHAARPAGVNEPTTEGVEGTEEILRRISTLQENDLCIVLISGGGSALLPAPIEAISLTDKLSTTRHLAASGARIDELNVVRSQLSRVKGGRLLNHVSAGQTIALIISDVVGDPLDVIASGPTVVSNHAPSEALAVLRQYDPTGRKTPESVYNYLRGGNPETRETVTSVHNCVIGSNSVALASATKTAQRLGYRVLDLGSTNEGIARHHAEMLVREMRRLPAHSPHARQDRWCVLAGGETTVQLNETPRPRRGGRNQEVVLAAINAMPHPTDWDGMALLSGGTDGEDGPTDAAGAVADAELVQRMMANNIEPDDFLSCNNSYPFFAALDGLLITGPTHTNVMDLAVGIVT